MLRASVLWIFAISAMSYEQPPSAAQQAADSALNERLARAEAVITGTVTSVAPAAAAPPTAISHHNPEWQEATIEVESVEKGKVANKTIHVLFANSHDIAWHNSPKLKKGDRGVFLLHSRDPFGNAVPGLAVVQPADKQPEEEAGKIRSLLKNGKK
jgi:hypothetical protein